VAVVGPDEVPAGWPVEDAGELLVLPGLVDTHVHVNEPGRTDWEGFATATRAAAAGGVTTLIDMPLNISPVTTTAGALRLKRQAAAGQCWVDVGFHGGVVPGNAAEVEPLIAAGVCAFKAFLCHSGIDEFPNAAEADLRAAMPRLAAAGLPLFVHAELVGPLPPGVESAFAANPRSYSAYLASRPPEWEVQAIRLMIQLCREHRCPVHIVHLAAAGAARPLIEQAKAEGLPLTVETCPHYLYFAAEEVPDGDPRFKCAPPIRGRDQRQLLREMVAGGVIDTLGSDHSPAPPGLKHLDDGDLRQAWGGIASLQLLLPVVGSVFEDVRDKKYLIDALTARPADLVGLGGRKGRIAPGRDADLVVVDPGAEFRVEAERLHHRHKPTPYDRRRLQGVVQTTYLRGRRVYDRGECCGGPSGELLERPRPTG
jgi:allantoinase